MWDTIKKSSLWVFGSQEGEDRGNRKNTWGRQKMAENYPYLLKDIIPDIHEAQRTLVIAN